MPNKNPAIQSALDLVGRVDSWTEEYDSGTEVNDYAEQPDETATLDYQMHFLEAEVEGKRVFLKRADYKAETVSGEREVTTVFDLYVDNKRVATTDRDTNDAPYDARVEAAYKLADQQENAPRPFL